MAFKFVGIAVAALGVLLTGCATPQAALPLDQSTLSAKGGRVGVAMTALPKADTYFPGADCLLCIATASAMNSTLSKHTQTLPTDDLAKVKEEIVAVLQKKGIDAVVVKEPMDLKAFPDLKTSGPNLAKKDFSALKTSYGIDRLLVVEWAIVGYSRTYAAYFPTSDPKATSRALGYLVDLNTNAYQWYMPVNVLRSAEGKWDEPPSYPGLTNAYYQMLEASRDEFLRPLAVEAQ